VSLRTRTRSLRILLVEDNPDDVAITRRALSKGSLENKVVVARDGQEALDLLKDRGAFEGAKAMPRPDLILLDLNLPRVDGREVLKEVKADRNLKRIPIVVLTTSERDEDILNSYGLGVNTYIRKPVNFDRFQEVIKTLHKYWVMVATLPARPGVG